MNIGGMKNKFPSRLMQIMVLCMEIQCLRWTKEASDGMSYGQPNGVSEKKTESRGDKL